MPDEQMKYPSFAEIQNEFVIERQGAVLEAVRVDLAAALAKIHDARSKGRDVNASVERPRSKESYEAEIADLTKLCDERLKQIHSLERRLSMARRELERPEWSEGR